MTYTFAEWHTVADGRDRRGGTTIFLLHTTGSGIVTKALDAKKNPNLAIPDYYDTPGANGPHEVITCDLFEADPKGMLIPDAWRVRAEPDFAPHAGIGPEAWDLYRKGFATWARYSWDSANKVLIPHAAPLERYNEWRARFPDLESPIDLLPPGCKNPNEVSLAWEMAQPVVKKVGGGWRTVAFTPRMHDVAAWRLADRAAHYAFPRDLNALRRKMIGHEDIHPIVRYDASGGWDVGAGKRGLWDWDLFFGRLAYYMQLPSLHPAAKPGWQP